MEASTTPDYRGLCTFRIGTPTAPRLSKLIDDLRKLRGVTDVRAEAAAT